MEERRCYGCMKLTDQEVCPHCGSPKDFDNDQNQLPVGTVLRDQYIVGKVLGHGGFGITYIGWDRYLDIVVAIKEFYPTHAVNRDSTQSLSVKVNTTDMAQCFEENRARFLREAKTLAKLRNIPQIVGVQSYFTENNTAYIIMDYVDGQDLRHYVQQRGGKVPAKEILPILEPVVHALSAVHKEGLMHRDISPDNIMLLPSGEIVLLDFGAARDLENADADADLSHSTEAILKHGFAPMEQYRSRGNLGPWTDEYGFCASVYYCLTGEVPPDAPARAMDDAQLDWNSIPGLTPNQRAALEKGMEMRAKDRFGSMEALHKALYEGAPVKKDILEKKKHRWALPLLLLTLLAAAAGGAVWYLGTGPNAQQSISVQKTDAAADFFEAPSESSDEAPHAATEAAAEAPAPTEVDITQEAWYPTVMVEDPFDALEINKWDVISVTFLDSLKDLTWKAVDLSQAKDGSIMGWSDWDDGYKVYIASETGINAKNCCKGLFQGCYNLRTISFGDLFHTDEATSMASMFSNCANLESVDLHVLKTGNVTDMSNMLYNCQSLSSINVSSWNVSKVKNMSRLFEECTNAKTLLVYNWDVSNVENMSHMFHACTGISFLEISNWDVSRVENLSSTFSGCSHLEYLNISSWNTSSVEDMSATFASCSNLTNLSINDWDVSNVINMSRLFDNCFRLRTIDLNNWDVSSVTDMSGMFNGCRELQTLEASDWDVSRVTNMTRMFAGCKNLTFPDMSGWDISRVRTYDQFTDAGILIDGKFWTHFFEK